MSEFEDRTRATLDESVARIDGRVRSRLTQARHAALDELAAQRSGRSGWLGWLQLRTLAPAGAVAAAAVVAVVLWSGRAPNGAVSVADASAAIEDVELLADNDALGVGAGEDLEFYEWAASEDDTAAPGRGT